MLVRVAARKISVSFQYKKTICRIFLALVFLGSRFLGSSPGEEQLVGLLSGEGFTYN